MRRMSVEMRKALAMLITLVISVVLIMALATYRAPKENTETETGHYTWYPDQYGGEGWITTDNGKEYKVGEYDVNSDNVPCIVTVHKGKVVDVKLQSTAFVDHSKREMNGYMTIADDGHGTIMTDDGNLWVVQNPPVKGNVNVTVTFSTNGTEEVNDDDILSIREIA